MPLQIVAKPPMPDDDDGYRLPMPGITSPIRLTVDSPGYNEDLLCVRCHEPWEMHRDSTGMAEVGCEGAILRYKHKLLKNDPSGNLHAEDLFPELTQRVLAELQVDCGPQMAWAARSLFTASELLIISRRLANAVVARIKDLEEGQR